MYINIGFEKHEAFLMMHDHRFRSTQGVLLASQHAGCSCFAVRRVFLFCSTQGVLLASQYAGCSCFAVRRVFLFAVNFELIKAA